MNPRPNFRGERRSPARQAGFTLFGLMFWGVLLGSAVYVGLKVFPTVTEYWTIQKAVNSVAASSPATVAEARAAFERHKATEYSIQSIGGNDLEVTKENDKVVLGFNYQREIPLFGPAYLLLKYQGKSK